MQCIFTRLPLALLLCVLSAVAAQAHGGGLDKDGGHYNRKTGEYHYHRQQSAPLPDPDPEPVYEPVIEELPDPLTDAAEYPEPSALSGPYEVLEVTDGDTIKVLVDGVESTIRMVGVDTPETVHPTKAVQTFGKEASDFTRNLLAGEQVWLSDDPGQISDRYQRRIAFVWRYPDRALVNLEIVRQGYGHADREYSNQYRDVFVEYEDRAREIGKGLWGE